MKSVRAAGLGLLFVLLFAIGAFAATQVTDAWSSARRVSSTAAPTTYRTVASGALDSIVTTTAIDPQSVYMGDTTLVVYLRTTNNAATGTVEVWLYGASSAFIGVSDVQNFVATTRTDGAGNFYPVRPLYFPLNGATSYDVRVSALSAGSVSLVAHSIGQGSIAAE